MRSSAGGTTTAAGAAPASPVALAPRTRSARIVRRTAFASSLTGSDKRERRLTAPARFANLTRAMRPLLRSARFATAFLLFAPLAAVAACDDDDCENGQCVCASGESCDFACEEPPCHVVCKGDNDECSGACANGDCTCGSGSNCDFTCKAS